MRFTFKTKRPTGKWRSFYNPTIIIKFDGKKCGNIDYEKPHQIRLAIEKKDINEDGNPNCSWKWIKFKKSFDSIDEAKKILNESGESIVEKFQLHFID